MAKIIHDYMATDSGIQWDDESGEVIHGTSNTLSSDEDLIFTGETVVDLYDPNTGNRDVTFSAPNIKMESLITIYNERNNSINFANTVVNFDGATWWTNQIGQGKILFSGDSKLNLTSESNKLLIICNDISGTITLDLDDSFVSGSTFSIQANAENNLVINNADGYEVIPTTDGTTTTYTVNRVSMAKEIKQITIGEETYLLKDETARNGLNDKQDIIPDLNTIRQGAEKGNTAVQPDNIPVKDVQANGTSILTDGVANIPLATSDNPGLVRPVQANGIYVSNTGTLNLSKLSNTGVMNKTANYAVLVNQIDLATKVGVTTNTIELTDEEKANACNWLGAGQKRTTVIDSTTPTVTIDNALSNTDYQYGTITSLTITSVENSYLETNFFFTAGPEITVDLPDTLKIIGSPSFEANKQYAMSICNNTLIVGLIS